MYVDAREDVALVSGDMPLNRIERHEESRSLFFLQFRNALFGLVCLAFFAQGFRLLWMEIQLMFLNDPLDLPRGDGCPICLLVQNLEFHLAVTDMRTTKSQDQEFLRARDFPRSRLLWPTALFFERCEAEGIKSFEPFVKTLARDTKVAAGERRVLSVRSVVVHPRKTDFRLFGKGWYAGELSRPR